MLRGPGLGREVSFFPQGWQLGGMASVRAHVLTSEVKCFCCRGVGSGDSEPSGHIPLAKRRAIYLAKDWSTTPSHIIKVKTGLSQQDASVEKVIAVHAWGHQPQIPRTRKSREAARSCPLISIHTHIHHAHTHSRNNKQNFENEDSL